MKTAFVPFPLRGRCIGISISTGDEGTPAGQNGEWFVNQLTFEACSKFLFLGASIALGHRWQAGGIMEHLVHRAAEFRHSFLSPRSEGRLLPVINRIAWPDEPAEFDEGQTEWVHDFIEVKQVLPPGIPIERLRISSKLGQFARIRALTAMRRELVKASDFRICLGGVSGKPLRRLPGVLEEALFTYEAGKPLYLAGALGGITKELCDVILRRSAAQCAVDTFRTPPEVCSLFAKFMDAHEFPPDEGPSQPGGLFDAFARVEAITIESLAERASLSRDEYLTLMTSPDPSRAMQFVSLGISRSASNPTNERSPSQ